MNVRKGFAKCYVGVLVVLGLYVIFGDKKESPKVVKAIQTEVE